MDQEQINEYIKKLQEMEKMIMNEESEETIPTDLDQLLKNLGNDIQDNYKSGPIKVRFKKLHPDAVSPKYAKPGDAGVDLTVTDVKKKDEKSVMYGFGLAVEIPRGYLGLLLPRSSASRYDQIQSNCVGIIDSGYRGELMANFKYTSDDQFRNFYGIGERACQFIIIPYPEIQYEEAEELSDTERGSTGFGSSGK